MPEPILQVKNLQVKLDHRVLLDHVDFTLNKGETIAVIGPNGAGKTTLFRALLGLVSYTGKIQWQPGIKIGYVPQKFAIDRDLPLTTAEFFALKSPGISKKTVESALHMVGLESDQPHHGHLRDHIINRRLGVLSGGELQRVIIAWALLDNPHVLLFDEPTAGIDISAEVTVYSLLHELQEEHNLSIMIISHELQLVDKYATNVICLNKKEVCFGPPQSALIGDNLTRLFGQDVGIYHHH
jgi:zinc transport system ATP-binding protein